MNVLQQNGKIRAEFLPILIARGAVCQFFLKQGHSFCGKPVSHHGVIKVNNCVFRVEDVANIRCDLMSIGNWARQEREKIRYVRQDSQGYINLEKISIADYRARKEREISEEIARQEKLYAELRGEDKHDKNTNAATIL